MSSPQHLSDRRAAALLPPTGRLPLRPRGTTGPPTASNPPVAPASSVCPKPSTTGGLREAQVYTIHTRANTETRTLPSRPAAVVNERPDQHSDLPRRRAASSSIGGRVTHSWGRGHVLGASAVDTDTSQAVVPGTRGATSIPQAPRRAASGAAARAAGPRTSTVVGGGARHAPPSRAAVSVVRRSPALEFQLAKQAELRCAYVLCKNIPSSWLPQSVRAPATAASEDAAPEGALATATPSAHDGSVSGTGGLAAAAAASATAAARRPPAVCPLSLNHHAYLQTAFRVLRDRCCTSGSASALDPADVVGLHAFLCRYLEGIAQWQSRSAAATGTTGAAAARGGGAASTAIRRTGSDLPTAGLTRPPPPRPREPIMTSDELRIQLAAEYGVDVATVPRGAGGVREMTEDEFFTQMGRPSDMAQTCVVM